jgi:hypothetical protein
MNNLKTHPKKLSDEELRQFLDKCAALILSAAYRLYDQAIAEIVEQGILAPAKRTSAPEALLLRQQQLPRPSMDVNYEWVVWSTERRDNWEWLMERRRVLGTAFRTRFGVDPPWLLEVRRVWMSVPRPRYPGRTPFPDAPC